MKFRLKPKPVEAVQLRWDTWSEMCEMIGAPGGLCEIIGAPVGLKDGSPEGCYVDAWDRETTDTNGRIGLKIPRKTREGVEGVEIAVQDDWVVRMDGELVVYKPEAFRALFESHADYKVTFEPDWSKYPKLAYRLRDSVDPKLNAEVAVLLTDARADAVQYVRDVRADELRKAREDERARTIEGAVRILEEMTRGDGGENFPEKWRFALSEAKERIRGQRQEGDEDMNREPTSDNRDLRQVAVLQWVTETFGASASTPKERALRLLEEAIELAQVEGVEVGDVFAVAEHVYGKPAGTPAQEVGGVGVTLLAYCESRRISAETAEQHEFERVLSVDPAVFRARHNKKANAGIAAYAPEPGK